MDILHDSLDNIMSHFQKRFALLKRPSFLAYIIGFFSAAVGNGLGYVALSWIVVTYHDKVSAMAILMGCFWGPNIILSPFMGVLADRLPRKWIMFISNLVRSTIYIVFSFYLRNHFSLNTVYAMMLLIGASFSAFFASSSAFTREVVPEKELLNGINIIDIAYEMGNMIGMGCAGLLIAWTSPETAILINGIAFVIATVSLLFIPKKSLCNVAKEKPLKIQLIRDFKEGLQYLIDRKKLFSIYTIQLLIFVTYLTTPLLLVPFSKSILHATVGEFGIIEAFSSIGIVVGGIFVPLIAEKKGLLNTLIFFCFALLITFLIFGYNRSIPIATSLYFVIGFAGAIWPLIISKAQHLTDLDFQGRVQSTFNSISGTFVIFFYYTIGMLGDWIGIQHLYLLEAIIAITAILFLYQTRETFQ